MTAWATALAEYQAKRAYSDALPPGASDEDAAVDAYCDAMDLLIAAPAPDLAALLHKIELARVRCEGFGMFDEYLDAIVIDIQALIEPRAEPHEQVAA